MPVSKISSNYNNQPIFKGSGEIRALNKALLTADIPNALEGKTTSEALQISIEKLDAVFAQLQKQFGKKYKLKNKTVMGYDTFSFRPSAKEKVSIIFKNTNLTTNLEYKSKLSLKKVDTTRYIVYEYRKPESVINFLDAMLPRITYQGKFYPTKVKKFETLFVKNKI